MLKRSRAEGLFRAERTDRAIRCDSFRLTCKKEGSLLFKGLIRACKNMYVTYRPGYTVDSTNRARKREAYRPT